KEANMPSKKLKQLWLSWDLSWAKNHPSELQENFEQILDVLQPHTQQLLTLGMIRYKGVHFPQWISSASLKSLSLNCLPNLIRLSREDGENMSRGLSILEITQCPKLLGLPCLPSINDLRIEGKCNQDFLGSIHKLGSLKSLRFIYNDKLTCFPDEMLQNLTSLKMLEFCRLYKLKWYQSSVDPMVFATSPSPPTFNYNQTLVPIFNGEAYDYWSIQMRTLFISQDLWDVIENGYLVPESQEELATWTTAKQKEYKQNKQHDAKALLFIQQGVSREIFPRIMQAKNAKEAWGTLKNEFKGTDKMHRLPFPKTYWRVKAPLKLVHADIWGPSSTPSFGGRRYFLLFVDDYTRMMWVYFIQQKSDAFSCFKEFKALVEKQSGHSLKILRTDRRGEFNGHIFINFCNDHGIKKELTVHHTPQQNGIAERKNITIVEMAQSMLQHKNLPKNLWAEVVSTTIYILNRSPTKVVLNMTPYEAWFNRKPTVDHFKVFGCVAYSHIPKENREKLDEKEKSASLSAIVTNLKVTNYSNQIQSS
ncbi:Retrovirus-related Pol polyprotein from transposon TNT 1-94, partial [Glycine soja]